MTQPKNIALSLFSALSQLNLPPKEGVMLLTIKSETPVNDIVEATGWKKRHVYERAKLLRAKKLITNHLTIHQTTTYSLTEKGQQALDIITAKLNEQL